jgi:hypothetical protein
MTETGRRFTRHESAESGFAKGAARIVAAVFLVVGVLGFVPAATVDFDSLEFAGHHSNARLLGLFTVSVLHNLVHVLFGVAGFLMARTARLARLYLLGGAAVYLLLWLYGLIVEKDSVANFVPLNNADDWLHLGLAGGMAMLGWFGAPGRSEKE